MASDRQPELTPSVVFRVKRRVSFYANVCALSRLASAFGPLRPEPLALAAGPLRGRRQQVNVAANAPATESCNGLGYGAIPLDGAHSTRSNRHSNPNAIFCSRLVMVLVSGKEEFEVAYESEKQEIANKINNCYHPKRVGAHSRT